MFNLHCHICNETYLVGTRSITSLHNTSEGPVAYARCPNGHLVLRYFHDQAARRPVPSEAA